MQRRPDSSLRPNHSEARRCGQNSSTRPMRPWLSRNPTSFSPSNWTRTGGQSGSGNSRARRAGIQYRRNTSPMGVPGPVRVTSSLSSRVSMDGLLFRSGRRRYREATNRGLQQADHRPIRRAPQVLATGRCVEHIPIRDHEWFKCRFGANIGANRGVLAAVSSDPEPTAAAREAFMDERELRKLVTAAQAGRMSRRVFVRRMTGLGLAAPLASQLLSRFGVAQAAAPAEYKPAKAGGGGTLKTLFWQAPTLLNPHFAVGTKDQEGSRIFYEPLAAWDPDGNLAPVLAAEVPEIENGGVAPDGMSVIWKLKKDVVWHDGRPFTADDVVFNWEYAADPATAATTIGSYQDATVEKLDPLTVRVCFKKPTPFWADAFVGQFGMIIPKHLFEGYKGGNSRDAPANLKPVGP